jgi:ATP-dependent DNA helicase RecG
MFAGSQGDAAKERLDALCRTNDGFEIAETDLRQRGPGDFFGSRQHGLPETRFAGIYTDPDIVEHARAAAEEIFARDPALVLPEHRELARRVASVFEEAAGTFN